VGLVEWSRAVEARRYEYWRSTFFSYKAKVLKALAETGFWKEELK
jgi:hypothetical protein